MSKDRQLSPVQVSLLLDWLIQRAAITGKFQLANHEDDFVLQVRVFGMWVSLVSIPKKEIIT